MGDASAYVMAGIAALLVGLAALVVAGPLRASRKRRETRRALADFRSQREVLEARFVDLAGRTGKPRGLRWIDCDFLDAVTFARHRPTGLLTAFVGVNIRFEALPGDEMESVAAVNTIRDATAVFHYQRGRWGTGGRALFNMNPHEALERQQDQFERIDLCAAGGKCG